MMNSDHFSFTQHTFFTKKKLHVYGNKLKLLIRQPFIEREMIFNLDEIDENFEQVSRRAYGWLAFLVIASAWSMIHFVLLLFKPAWTGDWFLSVFLLFILGLSLNGYLRGTYTRLTYNSLRIGHMTRQVTFHLDIYKKDKAAFEDFIERFNEILVWSRKRKELSSTIQSFPTDFLKEDFAFFYAEELLRRGIDIYQLFNSIKKERECLASYMSDSLMGRILN